LATFVGLTIMYLSAVC